MMTKRSIFSFTKAGDNEVIDIECLAIPYLIVSDEAEDEVLKTL